MTTPTPAVQPSGITSAEQFFNDHLSSLMARDLSRGDVNWCCEWTKHLEAVTVVHALWKAWEVLRQDKDMGPAVFMRDFVYRLMPELFSPLGTFSSCTQKRHDPKGVMPLPQGPED